MEIIETGDLLIKELFDNYKFVVTDNEHNVIDEDIVVDLDGIGYSLEAYENGVVIYDLSYDYGIDLTNEEAWYGGEILHSVDELIDEINNIYVGESNPLDDEESEEKYGWGATIELVAKAELVGA
jgi:hypothetical protein